MTEATGRRALVSYRSEDPESREANSPTEDPTIRGLRLRQKRNLVATLLLSQGVPMVLGGDELSHTQSGNNNAYCQDNELSWLDWNLSEEQRQFLEYVSRVIRLRRQHPVFARRRFLLGRPIPGELTKDVAWLTPAGTEMSEHEWDQEFARCLGVYLSGAALERIDRRGRPLKDENFLLLFNAHYEVIPFVLPQFRPGHQWRPVLDTAAEQALPGSALRAPGSTYLLQGRALALLTETPDE